MRTARSSFSGSRVAPFALHHAHQGRDHLRIELAPGLALQLADRVFLPPRRPIRPTNGHALVGVDDGEHASAERNALAGETARIARTVPVLVVAQDQLTHRAQILERADDLDAHFGVLDDLLSFVDVSTRSWSRVMPTSWMAAT